MEPASDLWLFGLRTNALQLSAHSLNFKPAVKVSDEITREYQDSQSREQHQYQGQHQMDDRRTEDPLEAHTCLFLPKPCFGMHPVTVSLVSAAFSQAELWDMPDICRREPGGNATELLLRQTSLSGVISRPIKGRDSGLRWYSITGTTNSIVLARRSKSKKTALHCYWSDVWDAALASAVSYRELTPNCLLEGISEPQRIHVFIPGQIVQRKAVGQLFFLADEIPALRILAERVSLHSFRDTAQ
jgi:hypothetical protein